MQFDRLDDVDSSDNYRVRYQLVYAGYTFEIQATKLGVVITGTTPAYTDWVPIQQVLSWAQYQAQKLRETSHPIPQHILERGEV